MLNLSDLKNFYTILDDQNCNILKKLTILKKLENWVPVKDYVVISNIGKVLYRCSKLSNELGSKAALIVNKWKNLILKPQNSSEQNKSSNNVNRGKNISNEVKLKNVSRKSHQQEVPQKKVCLSLKDYYKRKGMGVKSDSDNINNTNCNDNVTLSQNRELTSELGISFMDSFTIKPSVNIKQKKLLRMSEICALASTDSVRQRNDIITKPKVEPDNSFPLIDSLTERVDPNLKFWVPKAVKFSYSGNQPESLLKICQDVLLEYRMYIEEVYLTPRELLVTVLDNYSPEQLQRFEHFNPHYIEDNDGLWRKHFTARYANYGRQTNETWRQSYLRAVNSVQRKFELSLRNMKTKIEANDKMVPKISVMSTWKGFHSRPERKNFYLRTYDSNYSSATQKLRRQYKKQFAHLPF